MKKHMTANPAVMTLGARYKPVTLCWQVEPLKGDLQKQTLSLQSPRPSMHGGSQPWYELAAGGHTSTAGFCWRLTFVLPTPNSILGTRTSLATPGMFTGRRGDALGCATGNWKPGLAPSSAFSLVPAANQAATCCGAVTIACGETGSTCRCAATSSCCAACGDACSSGSSSSSSSCSSTSAGDALPLVTAAASLLSNDLARRPAASHLVIDESQKRQMAALETAIDAKLFCA